MCNSSVGYSLNSGLCLCFRVLLAFTLGGVGLFLVAVLFPAESVADKANKVSSRITYTITRDYQEVWEHGEKVETIKHYRVNGQKVATRDGEGLKFQFSDHLGSAALVSDKEGNKIKAHWYTPYGSDAKEDGVSTVRHKYNDKEHDDTGWYYYIARYQDPELGRFMSADMILPNVFDAQLLNRFTYVKNNPIRLVDPSGHNAVLSGVLQGLKFTLSFAGFDVGTHLAGTVLGDALVHYLDPPYIFPNPVGDYFLQFSNGGENGSSAGRDGSQVPPGAGTTKEEWMAYAQQRYEEEQHRKLIEGEMYIEPDDAIFIRKYQKKTLKIIFVAKSKKPLKSMGKVVREMQQGMYGVFDKYRSLGYDTSSAMRELKEADSEVFTDRYNYHLEEAIKGSSIDIPVTKTLDLDEFWKEVDQKTPKYFKFRYK